MFQPAEKIVLSRPDDQIGVWPLAAQLDQCLSKVSGPFRVSVEGELGAGKSSFMGCFLISSGFNAVEVSQLFNGELAQITSGTRRAIYFNAAAWPPAVPLYHAFLSSIVDALNSAHSGISPSPEVRKALLAPLAVVTAWASQRVLGGSPKNLREKGAEILASDVEALAWPAAAHRKAARGVCDVVAKLLPAAMGEQIPRVYLVVDNLDRAMPDETFAFLRCLESLAAFPDGSVILFSLDTAQMASWLGKRHEIQSGMLMLHKLFDQRIVLPRLRRPALQRVVELELCRTLEDADFVRNEASKPGELLPAGSSLAIHMSVALVNADCTNLRLVKSLMGRFCLFWPVLVASEQPANGWKGFGPNPNQERTRIGALLYFFYVMVTSRFPESGDLVLREVELKAGSSSDLDKVRRSVVRNLGSHLHGDIDRLLEFVSEYFDAFAAISRYLVDDHGFRANFDRINEVVVRKLMERFPFR